MGNLEKTKERLHQYAKIMGSVGHEIHGQIKGQIDHSNHYSRLLEEGSQQILLQIEQV